MKESTIAIVPLLSLVVACHPDAVLTKPPDAAQEGATYAASAKAANAGATVRVSPRAAMFYSRAGDPAPRHTFSARMVDSLGAVVAPPAPGLQWAVAHQGSGLRLGLTGVSDDGLTATAEMSSVLRGRDTLVARAAGLSGHGVTSNWEWASGSLTGPNWTVAGGVGCLEVAGRDSGGEAVRLNDFDHLFRVSMDPRIATVDSVVFSSDGTSARLCVTGHSLGRARVGVSAWDTTSFKYFGEYARYHVLPPPLSVAMAPEWELGVGQSHPVALTLTDNLGTTLPLDPEWADAFEVSDESILKIDNAVLAATAAGSSEFRVSYLGQEVAASVEVYAIAGGRFNTDVMCVLMERGTVRCWGDRRQPLWGYGRRTAGLVGPTGVGDLPLGGPAAQFRSGFANECARMVAGDVRCWGSATGGLLGYGNLEPVGDDETPADAGPVPIGVSGRVVDIGGGDDFVCTVYDSGRVRCWGSNHAGQLGMGHQEQINVGDDETPASMDSDVLLGGRAVQVAGGRYKACALMDTGKVRCWGINAEDWDPENKELIGSSPGLGYGASWGVTEPLGDDEAPAEAGDLPLPGRAKKIAVGGYHMCALMEDGAVRCWGDAGSGNLGHGDNWWEDIGDDETAAATVPLFFESPVIDLIAGYWHTCVLLANGSVRCWGDGSTSGQLGIPGLVRLGDDEKITSVDPVNVGGPVARIFPFEDGTCAIMRAGGLRCWGYNGGILGYPFVQNIGDDEHPASAGDIMVFAGPLIGASPGALPDESAGVPRSVVLVPLTSAGGYRPWAGPLAGPGGVILSDSLPEATRWTKER